MFQYHCALFNFSQILTKFSKNKEIIKQYQRDSDVGHEEDSETDEGQGDWRAGLLVAMVT